jgi:hypothetical protein
VQKLRIGWEGDVLGLHGGIDCDPRQILCPQGPTLVRHPQALSQEKLQLVAEALAPMAQVRALMRKLVLEELLSGEMLKVRIIDPAFAHVFVGQSVNVLEQQKPDHKPGRNSGPAFVALQRRDLGIDKLPVDLACELHQLVFPVPRAEQITRSCRLVALRPHRFPPVRQPNHACRFEGTPKMKLQASSAFEPESLQSQIANNARNRFSLSRLRFVHGRLRRP